MVLGYALAFAAGWLFAVSDVLIRGASRGLGPLDNLFLSLVWGLPVLGVLAVASGSQLDVEGVAFYSAVGALHFFLGRLLFYTAVAGVGSATAAILVSPTPLVAGLMAFLLLGEPLTPGKLVGLALVSAASYIAASNPTGRPLGGVGRLRGVAAGLLATAVFASTTVAVRWAGVEYGSPLAGATASYVSALLVTVAYIELRGGCLGFSKSGRGGGYMVYAAAGGVAVALAQASRYTALSLTPVAEAVALISLFPVNTVIVASIAPWTEERIMARHILAAAMAAGGAIMSLAM